MQGDMEVAHTPVTKSLNEKVRWGHVSYMIGDSLLEVREL